MKLLVVLLLFAFVGKIASTPRIAYRSDDDSAESDETDVEADDEPVGESSEEVPEWSFREIPQESRWQQQSNQVQNQGHFQEPIRIQGNHNFHQGQGVQQQGSYFSSPIRRFRDDDSEEEDEEDDEDFNDDVVDSDISYSPPSSVRGGVPVGGFRSIIAGRGRASSTGMVMTRRPGSVSSRPMSTYNGMRMPVYDRMPMYNRVPMSSGVRRPSYSGQRQYDNRYVSMNPYRRVPQGAVMNYPVRRVATSMAVVNRGQRPGMGMMYRPVAYDRQHMMPYRRQSYNYNRQPMMTRNNGGVRRV